MDDYLKFLVLYDNKNTREAMENLLKKDKAKGKMKIVNNSELESIIKKKDEKKVVYVVFVTPVSNSEKASSSN